MERILKNIEATVDFGGCLGEALMGGEVIELVGDVGAGKTTLVKGIASALGITEPVQSPTFTISRVYEARDGLTLAHYDFYRLNDAGIMREELAEAISEPRSIVILEWADVVDGVLPEDRLTIELVAASEDERQLEIHAGGTGSRAVLEKLQ